jgi:hypothetical protein
MMFTIVLGGYLVIVGFMFITQLIAWRHPHRIAPLGEMLERQMIERTTRVGIIAAWWWCGWHFVFAPPA